MGISNDIDSYLRKRKVTADTKITLALLIELLAGFSKEKPDNSDGWISVEDRLPEVGEFILVYNTEGATLTGRLMNDGWVASFLDGEKDMGELTATYWQLLPLPPKK